MAKYSGTPVLVNQPAPELFDRISDINAFQHRLDELPRPLRDKMGQVAFTDNKILIEAPGVGQIAFAVVERIRPSLIRLQAENSPVPFFITMQLESVDSATTRLSTILDVEIPAMLRPLVGSKMQEAADKFSEMLSNFFGR